VSSSGGDVGGPRGQVDRGWLALRDRENLTYLELSQRCGIRANALAHWAWRLRQERSPKPEAPSFVELVTTPAPANESASRSTPSSPPPAGSSRAATPRTYTPPPGIGLHVLARPSGHQTFANCRPVGAVEAEPLGRTLTGIAAQSARCAASVLTTLRHPVRDLPRLLRAPPRPDPVHERSRRRSRARRVSDRERAGEPSSAVTGIERWERASRPSGRSSPACRTLGHGLPSCRCSRSDRSRSSTRL